MADKIDYTIHGEDLQAVEISLDPGEGVRAEAGAVLMMDAGITMQTSTEGGIFKGLKRAFTGESFFITSFTNNSNVVQKVSFAAPYPGKIIPLNMSDYGGVLYCQKDSFLCCARGNDVEVAFVKKLGAGFFGGEGFVLQKILGDGLTFIHSGGTIIVKDLAVGEVLRVDTGCVVGFTQGVKYNIQTIGGFKNVLFGGEGLFMTTLEGPGRVFIQTLPFSRLADRLKNAFAREATPVGIPGLS